MASNKTNTGIEINGSVDVRNSQAKDIKILTSECPANMFANKRMPKLTARAIYEINSIRIINGAITVGVPVGYKIEIYRTLCSANPIKIIDTSIEMLNKNANEASLVIVSSPGIIPTIFALK